MSGGPAASQPANHPAAVPCTHASGLWFACIRFLFAALLGLSITLLPFYAHTAPVHSACLSTTGACSPASLQMKRNKL